MVFTFLITLVKVLESYFKDVQEESIRDNFVVVYELLDEMMDNGYPQTTEIKLLKGFIKTESYELSNPFSRSKGQTANSIDSARGVTNVVSWRQEGIKYSKNEFFLDVVEKLSMLIGPTNNIIKSEIIGVVNADCQLSGMPDLKLGLNDKAYYEAQGRTSRNKAVEFNDIKFHQCVRLGRFENERLVTFIPPDGKFELMSYRLDIRVKPLFSVDVIVENPSNTRIRFVVKVKSNYKERSIANNVDIFVPVPEDVESPHFNAPTGHAVYVPEHNALKWTIKQFAGHKYSCNHSGTTC